MRRGPVRGPPPPCPYGSERAVGLPPRVITYKSRNGAGTPARPLVILGRKTVWVGLRWVTAAAGRSGEDSWPSASVGDRGRYSYSCHPERREGSQPATMMRFFAGPRMTVRRTFFPQPHGLEETYGSEVLGGGEGASPPPTRRGPP